ncbi:MAG: FAD-dependent oxidoreductase [Candidatus Kryptoniota bacterium]
MGNIVIVGGMAAGCKVASRLSRLVRGHEIIVVEKTPFVSMNNCGLLSFVGGEIDNLSDLMKTSYNLLRDEKYFENVRNVRVLTKTEVCEINTRKRELKCVAVGTGNKFQLMYDSLVIATGIRPSKPQFPFVDSPLISSFHYPSDALRFREGVQHGAINKVAIIGGGIKGCSLAESLITLWGIDVVLIEKEEALLPTLVDLEVSCYIQSSIQSDKLSLFLWSSVEKIECNEKGSPVIHLKDGQSISVDYVFYCIGVKPNTELARAAGILVGSTGGILVDEKMRTSAEHVWAAGGCVELTNMVSGQGDHFPCSSLSLRMGRTAADSIVGRGLPLKGTVRSLSMKLFDKFIGCAGLTEKSAGKIGIKTGSVIGCWPDQPDYYHESKPVLAKLIYEKPGLRLLGLQLVGEKDVTRYIDLFSDLLLRRRTVESLLQVELASSSAYSAPDTLLNHLGSMAISQELDGATNVSPINAMFFKGTFIDVRETQERSDSPFSNSCTGISLTELKTRLKDFSTDQEIVFVCGMGARGYEATRMFLKHGYKKVSYLGGGVLLYNAVRVGKFKWQDKINA